MCSAPALRAGQGLRSCDYGQRDNVQLPPPQRARCRIVSFFQTQNTIDASADVSRLVHAITPVPGGGKPNGLRPDIVEMRRSMV